MDNPIRAEHAMAWLMSVMRHLYILSAMVQDWLPNYGQGLPDRLPASPNDR